MKQLFVKAVAGLVFIGANNIAFGDIKEYDILLIPQGNGGTMGVKLDFGKPCNVKQHDGCMDFDVNTVGVITLKLTGSPHRLACAPEGAPNPQQYASKVITKIELTSTPMEGDTTSSKGDFSGGLEDWLKQYAFLQVNQTTGVLYEVPKEQGLARLTLVNLNSHPSEEGGSKSFWYRITVTDCDDESKTWVTDPRGDNKGLN